MVAEGVTVNLETIINIGIVKLLFENYNVPNYHL